MVTRGWSAQSPSRPAKEVVVVGGVVVVVVEGAAVVVVTGIVVDGADVVVLPTVVVVKTPSGLQATATRTSAVRALRII